MKLTTLSQALLFAISPFPTTTANTNPDPASACYNSQLPILSNSTNPTNTTRSIPWGTPSYTLPNGTTCCSFLPQIRSGINDIDDQLLVLLAQRAAYVREATRFKQTLGSVDVPSRDREVVEGAVEKARDMNGVFEGNGTGMKVPEVVVRSVFEAVINGSVPFEGCVWESF